MRRKMLPHQFSIPKTFTPEVLSPAPQNRPLVFIEPGAIAALAEQTPYPAVACKSVLLNIMVSRSLTSSRSDRTSVYQISAPLFLA